MKHYIKSLLIFIYLIPIYLFPKKVVLLFLDLIKVACAYFHLEEIIGVTYYKKIDGFKSRVDLSNVAIVIQGPIYRKDNFTFKVLLSYRKAYPNVTIVLSTWRGELNTDEINLLKKNRILYVVNNYPSDGGVGHVNYQIASSLAGVVEARKVEGLEYILKSRTDQEFNRPHFLESLINIYKNYERSDGTGFNRIVFLAAKNSYKFIPYHVSDFMSFGHKNDIYNLYSIRYDETVNDSRIKGFFTDAYSKISKADFYSINEVNYDFFDYCLFEKFYNAETYIIKNYVDFLLKKRVLDIQSSSLLQYWHFLANYAVIIDSQSLLFYWPKYDSGAKVYNVLSNDSGSLDYLAWLDIYRMYNK